ncbi:Stk1 family PASTA domain-containing Ser/Thr kinase [Actinoallomurus sp. NBC_01490]|uniref:Stk1 family PASTA domain-containing Ser/Thr kinase n=1 Tax=Actinoallomurus sp. NBC_01490 TaxID=2903557 RepID=UPI002E306BE8|nr:Stk1 family PASTA domain-containing Ser/Thr kinase [Actinoallomurus sp. NBC_01490]
MEMAGADPLVGHVLDGRYVVGSRVARGGMATVYAGHDTKLDRAVALKVMHANLAGDEDFVRRFADEARHAAALSHPNVVAMYDQGTDQGRVFLVMEYVAGRTLRDLLTERGRLGPRAALRIMRPILAALGAAHRVGLVHRDVKPENVLLAADGQVKVTDFGLARAETASRHTKTGILIGTVAYLAPEQVLTGDADARTDVYAAGIMLFELLTGYQPYQAGTPLAVAYRHVNETVPPPSSVIPGLPPQLDALVAGATDRDPARRPPDADRFHAAAGEVLRSLPPDIDAISASAVPVPPGPSPAAGGTQAPPPERVTQNLHAHPDVSSSGRDGTTRTPSSHTMVIPDHEGPSRKWRRRPRTYGLFAAAVVVALLLGGFVWFQTAERTARVPQLVGLSEADARLRAERLGLKVKAGSFRQDPSVPKDKVAQVEPGAGTQVRTGTLLTLTLSSGRPPVAVPDVRNQPLGQAEQRLRQAGLQPGRRLRQDSATVPRGDVITTRPAAGKKQNPDEPVTVVVSRGMTMPDLSGLTPDQAARKLAALGLNAQWRQQPPDGGRQPNTVVGQDPPAGRPVNRGDDVQVTFTDQRQCEWGPFCSYGDGQDGGDG